MKHRAVKYRTTETLCILSGGPKDGEQVMLSDNARVFDCIILLPGCLRVVTYKRNKKDKNIFSILLHKLNYTI